MRRPVQTPGPHVARTDSDATATGTDDGPGISVEPSSRPARLMSVRNVTALVVLVVLALLPLSSGFVGPYGYVIQVCMTGLMWATYSSSWNILGGFTGYVSLGHNVFIAVGAYFSGYLLVFHGMSPFLTAPAAGLLCVVLGIVVGLITLRTYGDGYIIATIALLLLVRISLEQWNYLGGTTGLNLPIDVTGDPEFAQVPFYYAMLVLAVLSIVLSHRVSHSKLGLGLRALAEDEVKAAVAGVDVRLYKIVAYALSALFTGMAGVIWAYSLSYVTPSQFLTLQIAAQMMLMAVLGGRGTVAGPVIGAVIMVAINEVSTTVFGSSEINLAVTGILLVVVLMLFPSGIVGSLRDRRRLPSVLNWD
jgi:branched-chain amino acid transport system permease protein